MKKIIRYLTKVSLLAFVGVMLAPIGALANNQFNSLKEDLGQLFSPAEAEYQANLIEMQKLNKLGHRPPPPSHRPPPPYYPPPHRRPPPYYPPPHRPPPPYYPPPHRPPPPRPYPPYPDYSYTVYQCVAENMRGDRFIAEDRYSSYYAQDEAMRRCYRHSHRCFEMGCRVIRRY